MSTHFRRHAWWVYILIFLFTQLLAGFGVAALQHSGLGASLQVGSSLAAAMFCANLLGILLFFCFRPQTISWSGTLAGLRGRKGRRSGLVFLLALPITMLVNLGQEVFFPDIPNLVGDDIFRELMFDPLGLLTVCLIGPVCEELLFRGGVQTDISQHHSNQGWMVPILLSSLLFSIAHLNPAQMPIALILGLLLGFAYWWTGSLFASICIHVFNNSFASLLGILAPDDDSLVHFLGGPEPAGITALVCLFLLYILLRAVQKEGFQEV